MMDDESRIHLLGNGNGTSLTARQRAKQDAQNVSVGEVNALIAKLQDHNKKMIEFYMEQIPDMVAGMIKGAFEGYDLAKQAREAPGEQRTAEEEHAFQLLVDRKIEEAADE